MLTFHFRLGIEIIERGERLVHHWVGGLFRILKCTHRGLKSSAENRVNRNVGKSFVSFSAQDERTRNMANGYFEIYGLAFFSYYFCFHF